MTKKFLRRTSGMFSKLGRGRKKKQTWRRPTGRDNKMREKRNGRPPVVSIGYKTNRKDLGLIKDKKPIRIFNEKDLLKIKSNMIGIVGNVGQKKRILIVQKAAEMKLPLHNIHVTKFLKNNSKKPLLEKKK